MTRRRRTVPPRTIQDPAPVNTSDGRQTSRPLRRPDDLALRAAAGPARRLCSAVWKPQRRARRNESAASCRIRPETRRSDLPAPRLLARQHEPPVLRGQPMPGRKRRRPQLPPPPDCRQPPATDRSTMSIVADVPSAGGAADAVTLHLGQHSPHVSAGPRSVTAPMRSRCRRRAAVTLTRSMAITFSLIADCRHLYRGRRGRKYPPRR